MNWSLFAGFLAIWFILTYGRARIAVARPATGLISRKRWASSYNFIFCKGDFI